MAMVNDRTTLNDMDTQADADQWTSPSFDAIGLNDTNSPTRIYREGGGSGNMIIKGGTDSYWYDDMTFDLTGAIRTGKFKVLVMWLWFSGPASTDNMTDILIGMYDGTGGQGGGGNGGRWHYKPIIEAQNTWGWIPAMAYPTQPDETSGTFASLVESSMDSIELDVDNGTNDVKLAGIEACFIISYIGGHSQTVTFQNLVDHSEDKTNDRDFGVAAKLDANGNIFKFRVSLRLGDAAATATTTFSESDKTVLFDNVNTDHEIGYDLINDTTGDLLVFSPSGVTHIWNDGNSELWTGEELADTWTPEACTWVNGGGGAVLPVHVTGKTTNNHTFKNCGSIDIGDAVCEGCSFSGANTEPAVIYVGSGTRRIKNSRYTGRAIAVSFDTAQTVTMDGDTFSGNTYDIENSASSTTADSYPDTNYNSQTNLNGTNLAVGQSITGNGGVLSSVIWRIRRVGVGTTGNMVAKLYAHSGTFGTSSLPTGSPLDTSNIIDIADIDSAFALVTFQFEGGYTLTSATNYVVVLEYTGTLTNYLAVSKDNSAPTHGGNASHFTTVWTAFSTVDFIFYLYTGGILTINATNGANPSTVTNTGTPPGIVIIQNAVTVKVTAVTITNTPIQGVRVYLKTDPGGIVILNGLTDVNGEISAAYNYSSDQNVNGWARKSSTTPLYKEAPLVGTITSAGLNAAATMILDE